MQRIESLLRLHFALLAAFGGLILGFSDDSGSLPVIAVCSSLFAYVFVDLLKLFSLPPLLGYLAMGLIAAYCISDFIPLTPASNRQLLAVAQLLVLVQAVLMLQTKSRRTFEQIGIFSLLEIVVAAVFNHALTFALLLVPIAILGISAMVLLQVYTVSQPLAAEYPDSESPARAGRSWVQTRSPTTVQRLTSIGPRLPRSAIVSLGPAVFLVGLVFFYAIPRTAESDGIGLGGVPQVGFSDSVTLDQIGQLQRNKTIVMRVRLRDANKGTTYQLSKPLYLRGRILDQYDFDGGSGQWTASPRRRVRGTQRLPREFIPSRTTDNLFFDRVDVEISQQPQSTRTAFSIAPYYRTEPGRSEVGHSMERWLLTRRDSEIDTARSRVTYRFGTHAFRDGMQLSMIRCFASGEQAFASELHRSTSNGTWAKGIGHYDAIRLPELTRTAQGVADSLPTQSQQPYSIANRLNQYVASEAGLRYTLDLNFAQDPDLDPVEEFLTVHRAGHCQYFASTLALMLRSQGIPSRLVVGYKTSEYSPYGEHYVVRQSDAHVWVEALLTEDQLPKEQIIYGQPDTGPVWMRLDPTPAGDSEGEGQVTQAIDYAQGIWEKWVLDMDGRQQQESQETTGLTSPLMPMFESVAEHLKGVASKGVGAGSLSGGNWFSFPAAAFGIGATLLLLLVLRVRIPWTLFRSQRPSASGLVATQPQLDFFAELCTLLKKMGLQRNASQTPREFVDHVSQAMRYPHLPSLSVPLRTLADRYYAIRFGNAPLNADQAERVQQALDQVRVAVEQLTPNNLGPSNPKTVVGEPPA